MEQTKELLIGKTRDTKKITQEYFDALVKVVVYQPFENLNTVSHCFCRKCGMHGEITKRYAEGLIRTMILLGESPEASPENQDEMRMHYFVTDSCELCHIRGQSVKVEQKKINFDV